MPTKYSFALLIVLIAVALLFVAGCGGGCPTQTGGGTGSGSGGPPSGVTSPGCSAGGVTPPPPAAGNNSFVYFANGAMIEAAKFNTSGTLSTLNPFTPVTLPSSSLHTMAVVSNKFLYVPMNGFSNVQAFTINQSSGALTSIGNAFPAQAGADVVTSDPNGRFLFVGGRNAALISVYRIDATSGVLTPVAGSPFQSFNVVFSNSLVVDGSGKFLYVGQMFATNPVAVFSIDQTTGALTETPNSPFPLGVSVLRATPNGQFLLGVPDDSALTTDNHVRVFSINSTNGDLTPVTGSPFTTVNIPFDLAIHPSSNLVYVSTADATQSVQALEGFQLDANGKLTALAGSPFTTIPVVAYCQFVQSGADTVCANAGGFSVLGVNTTTGALSHTVTDLTTTGKLPFAATN